MGVKCIVEVDTGLNRAFPSSQQETLPTVPLQPPPLEVLLLPPTFFTAGEDVRDRQTSAEALRFLSSRYSSIRSISVRGRSTAAAFIGSVRHQRYFSGSREGNGSIVHMR
ncbi:unnamed protein product [Lactuca virosa]|uniref:Uncharacterized protein n=1 Tax=Lactuca virosa TaxID=75947 RepID=A0AAU9P6P8_9ASTR|nr:unnamed protein product [Lactuca virosa]